MRPGEAPLPVRQVVPDDELLDAHAVAKRFAISVATLMRLVQRGEFPQPLRYSRKLVRWKRSTVQNWLAVQEP
jgi:predicted DNA-binding transcriptional regulator AlpA